MGTLTILPTSIAARDWTVRMAGGGALFGHAAMARSQFVRRVHSSVHPQLYWMSEPESLALLTRTISEYYEKHPGAFFAALKHRAGFWRSLHRFLNECRMSALAPRKLADVLHAGGIEDGRAKVLAGFLGAYLQRIEELNATDNTGAESALAADLQSGFPNDPFFEDIDQIDIRGVYDIPPVTFDWILALAGIQPTTLYLPLPDEHPRTLKWLRWIYSKFEYLEDQGPAGFQIQAEDLQNDRALTPLLSQFMTSSATLRRQKTEPLSADIPIRVMEADGARREIIEVARHVAAILENGTAPQKIAVLIREPRKYPNAGDVFTQLGIVTESSSEIRSAWTEDPLGREVLDAATLAANGFEREELIGWAGRTRGQIPEALRDPDTGRILRESHVTKGTLASHAACVRSRINARRSLHDKADALAKALDHLAGILDPLAKSSAPHRYIQRLQEAGKELAWGSAGAGSGDAILRNQFHRLARLWGGWDETLEPHVLLDLILAAWTTETPSTTRGGVRLLSVNDVAALDIDHLFIIGMTAGAFPLEPKQEVFLKDDERETVTQTYVESRKEELGGRRAGHRPFDTAGEERLRENFLFYLCIAQARQSVMLSYPRTDSQGRPAPVSPFIDEIGKLFKDPKELLIAHREHPRSALEHELAAVAAVIGGKTDIIVPDAGRFRRIARRLDIEQRRERFYLERRRSVRGNFSFDFTGRLSLPGPFWTKPDMAVRAVESFAACPFKGFAAELAGLREIDRPIDGLSAKDLGILLHRFLELFWTEMKRRHDRDRSRTEDVMQTARTIIRETLDQAVGEAGLAAAGSPLWNSQKRALRFFLDSVLDMERTETLDAGFWPLELEKNIVLDLGTSARPPLQSLHGRLDRLDSDGDGNVRVFDYKLSDTNFLREKKRKTGETEFQLPIYALAALRESGRAHSKATMAYVSLRHAADVIQLYPDPMEPGQIQSIIEPRLSAILDAVAHGIFDVTPTDDRACESCDFRRACRVRPNLAADDDGEEEGA